MLWLMLLILWGLRLVFGGTAAAAPAARTLIHLLVLLGLLQVLITIIDILGYVMGLFST